MRRGWSRVEDLWAFPSGRHRFYLRPGTAVGLGVPPITGSVGHPRGQTLATASADLDRLVLGGHRRCVATGIVRFSRNVLCFAYPDRLASPEEPDEDDCEAEGSQR
jgi:hypothetical protein